MGTAEMLGGSGLCLKAAPGGLCPHPASGHPGTCEPLAYLESRYQTLPRVETAVPLRTPSSVSWVFGPERKRRLVFMIL